MDKEASSWGMSYHILLRMNALYAASGKQVWLKQSSENHNLYLSKIQIIAILLFSENVIFGGVFILCLFLFLEKNKRRSR